MLMMYLQGYLCDEDPDDLYVLDVTCGSADHQIMIGVCTLLLLLFLAFLFYETLLFNSNNFESNIPWASLERNVTLLKIVVKLIQCGTFVFDKQGNVRGYVNLVCFLLYLLLLYSRLTSGIIFVKTINYATIIYESLNMTLSLFVAASILSDNEITISTLALFVSLGLVVGLFCI